jgi:capsular polysaccharide biosynthesis protein
MLAALIVVFAIVYIFTVSTHEDMYTATTTVWALGSNASTSSSTSTSDVSIGTQLIHDYKELILSTGVLEVVLERNENIPITSGKLRGMISIGNTDGSRVMYVSVTSPKPSTSKQLADDLANVFCDRVNEMNKDNDVNEDKKTLVRVWDSATTPTAASNPISMFRLILISLIAAIAVYGVFFVMYLLDDKISTADDVEKYLGVNILGMIPNRYDAQRKKKGKSGYYYSYSAYTGSESENNVYGKSTKSGK